MKRILCYILSISLVLSVMVIPANALTTETPETNAEVESMQRLMALGVFSKTDPDKMNLSDQITREQLAVVLVLINGQQDKLDMYTSTSLFTDVPISKWSNPYINVAVKSGYMEAKTGGKFLPLDKVDFITLGEIFGKLLNYDDAYLPGSSNEKYLMKLEGLGILNGIKYSPSAFATRGQIALMLDRLLSARVFGTDTKFIDTVPAYKSAIVLENSIINTNADERQIVSDKGIFYLKKGVNIPEAGKHYYFKVKDNEILNAALTGYQYKEYSVSSFTSGTMTTNDREKVKLPGGIKYYYQGSPIDYGELNRYVTLNSSVIIAYDGTDAVYGVVYDPLYSEPEVVTAAMVGISLEIKYKGLLIDKGGKYIPASQIEINDVVYRVTDLWNRNAYIVVYDNTVSGRITAILPSKVSPDLIEIDGTSYTLDETFDKYKISSTGKVQVGETVKLILGTNGKAVDIISDTITGTNYYALVLNAYTENSIKSEDYGTPYYYVTLLHSDGGKKTYLAEKSMLSSRGKLVVYEIIATGEDYDTVRLRNLENNASGSYIVNKDERKIGNDYVANGAVLFNIENTAAAEIEASVISFSDIYDKYLMDGTVKYIHRSGDFMDIDVMLLDDALGKGTAYGLVIDKKATALMVMDELVVTETLTLMVNGQIMIYVGDDTGLYVSSVAKVKLDGNNIRSIQKAISAEGSSSEIQAVDSSRIRINNKVYSYHRDLAIYKRTSGSGWKTLEPSDLKKGTDNGNVSIFLDKTLSYGGKVVMILVR
ncbi:MAG: S-layer homology domain-containing protein [Acetivibrionales bacterium]|jgi:hypothetical protein